MKNLFIIIFCCISKLIIAQPAGVVFHSSDTAMEKAFSWAKEMALQYQGKPTDSVGAWYESALPPRYAFCMRDVSHQCIGGEILGLHSENKNMFTLFAKNISDNKDWCSYWEINRNARPAPEDYRNDKEFWYNLPANFDVMAALWRLYLWTGDKSYISDPVFQNFYNKSLHEYITRWVLAADSLLPRPAHPNAPAAYNENDPFHRSRGLPSYSEGVPNLKMGIDLIAAIYNGFRCYSEICKLNGDLSSAGTYAQKAGGYQSHLDANWWDEKENLYNTYYSNDNRFGKNEGETFLLWFDALKNADRKKQTIAHLLASDLNVENLSYLPFLLYEEGYWQQAYDKILFLSNPATERREYPEVSFGVIEGIVQGVMGLQADARTNTLATLYRSQGAASSSVMNVPVLKTSVDLVHSGVKKSTLTNKGKTVIVWRAMFKGNYRQALTGDKKMSLKNMQDKDGSDISYIDITVSSGKRMSVTIF